LEEPRSTNVRAARWRRLVAWYLDSLTFVPAELSLEWYRWFAADSDAAPRWVWLALAALLATPVFVIDLRMLRRSGWTIGKRLLGIRIVRGDGSRAGLLRVVLVRMAPMWASEALQLAGSWTATWVGLAVFVVVVLLIFTPARRCLHDWLADTIVVDSREPERRRSAAALPDRNAAG